MPVTQNSPEQKRIILVDDNEIDAFILKGFLSESGFSNKLEYYADPFKALALLTEIPEQDVLTENLFIFLDLHMPLLNGVEFLYELQKQNPMVIRRIYILSSEYIKIQHKLIGDFPVAGFISKPFSLENVSQLFQGPDLSSLNNN